MYDLSDSYIEELKGKNYLAEDGHPSIEAYRQVFSSPSADIDNLAIAVEKHGRDCPICGERYKKASSEILEKKYS